jgi:DNA invertase Pin-like site-specific DNA recombinase
MVYAYIRVSTDKQTVENQEYEIYKFADDNELIIDKWIKETVSGTKSYKNRKLGTILEQLEEDDIIVVSEISRFGRSLMEVMGILNEFMEKKVKVFSVKEKYELGDNIGSKVLAFAFSLSADIERQMISQRTREALERKKAEGKKLGRPKGRKSAKTKLTGKDNQIKELLKNKVSYRAIGRILGVHPVTVSNYIQKEKLLLAIN